ncbi:hypothetical protein BFC18_10805 [Alteromonas confluentis]|uniref:Transposase n=1 Tax=Alteromonas confluentis TaxID=1656094 RepID=A0A1E7ZBU9_9ALTE|nr:hypothetical protein BFC18_10805 [Alteromonas confluentis]
MSWSDTESQKSKFNNDALFSLDGFIAAKQGHMPHASKRFHKNLFLTALFIQIINDIDDINTL